MKKQTPKYDATYFIKKFSKIPDSEWCVGFLKNANGQRCALGHCDPRVMHPAYFYNSKVSALSVLFAQHFLNSVIHINDRCIELGETPKERILVALEHLKGAGF